MRTVFCLLVQLAYCVAPVFSQHTPSQQQPNLAQASTATGYEIRYLGLREGLTNREVLAILHDHDGFVWIGTRTGLLRYDGFEFMPIALPFPSELVGKKPLVAIEWIHEDPENRLWVGTQLGLVLFPKGHGKPQFVSELAFSSVVQDGKNLLLSNWGNIFRLFPNDHPNQLPRLEKLDWIASAKTRTLFSGPDNTFFLTGNVDGAIRMRGDSVLQVCAGASPEILARKVNLKNGQTVVRSHGTSSFWRFDAAAMRFEKLPVRPPSHGVAAAEHPLFYAQMASRYAEANPGLVPTEAAKLLITSTYCWETDAQGQLWLGTLFGIFVLVPRVTQFEHLDMVRGMSCRAIFQDGDDVFVSSSGLHCWNKTTGQRHNFSKIPPSRVLIPLDKQRLLLAGEYNGQYIVDRKTNALKRIEIEKADHLPALIRLRNGQIWYWRLHRFYQFLPEKDTSRHLFDLPMNSFYDAVEDSSGQIWLSGGFNLLKIERDSEGQFTTATPLIPGKFNDGLLLGDTLWLATGGNGLIAFDTKREENIAHFTAADGLSNDFVNCLLPDASGKIWMSTNEGLSRFDPKNNVFVNFSRLDGLEMDEYNRASAWRDPATGRLYFGGLNGVTHFDPATVQLSLPAPRLLFSKIVHLSEKDGTLATILPQNDPALDAENEIVLAAGDRYLEFHMATNDPANSAQMKFVYQLEGFDKNWVSAGKTNIVRFALLPAGDYVFRVKAVCRSGIFSAERIIRIHVKPAFYQTWWFISSMLVLAGGLYFWFDRQRAQRLDAVRAAEREREQNIILAQDKQLAEAREILHLQELENTRATLHASKLDLEQTRKLLELKNELLAQFEETTAIKRSSDEADSPGESSMSSLRELKILTDSDWRDFQERFKIAFPGTMERLREQYPELTNAEIRLFLLLKIGMVSREIAEALGISVESVWRSRHRLKKKMDMPENINFDDWVRDFA